MDWHKPGWVALDEEATRDYLDGEVVPLQVRETQHGVEVFMPHTFRVVPNANCWHCGLLPLDYDAIETECVPGHQED